MRILGILLLVVGVGLAAEPLPTAMELVAMEAREREAAVERLCREAGPGQRETLLELARQPELAGRHLGALGVALARLTGGDAAVDAAPLLATASPSSQFLAMMLLRAPGSGQRELRQRLADSPEASAGVRAWARLETWDAHLPYAGGHPHACQEGIAEPQADSPAFARICQAEASTWCNPWSYRDEVLTAETELGAATPIQVLWVGPENPALVDAARREQMKAWLKGNRTLYLVGGAGRLPAGTDRMLAELGLPMPRIETAPTVYVANLAEPHPLIQKLYLLTRAIVHQPLPDGAAAEAAAALAPDCVAGRDALIGWDRVVWAAPFVGLNQPGRACWLESPPTWERGRVVLDVTGARLSERGSPRLDFNAGCIRQYQAAANLQAHLLGVGSVKPMKNFYNTRGDLDFSLPHPYYPVSEEVASPHVKWGGPRHEPILAVFCLPDVMVRAGVELRQRLPNLSATYLPFSEKTFGAARDKQRTGPPMLDGGAVALLKRFQVGPGRAGVLVLPALESYHLRHAYELSWRQVPDAMQASIAQAVAAGMGLVFIGPDFDPAWMSGPPLEPVEPPAWLTATLPMPRERALRHVAGYRLGNGLIAHVKIPMLNGTAPLALDDGFLVPGLAARETMRVRADEYGFGLAAAALFWAAGREFETNANSRSEYVDRFGFRHAEPPPGPAIRHTWYTDYRGEATWGWAATRIGPERGVAPTVTLRSQIIAPGAALAAGIEGAGDRVRVEVLDHRGRLRRRVETALTDGKAAVTLPGWTPLARWHDLRVTVWQGETIAAQGVTPFAVAVTTDRHDAQWWVTPAPASFIPGLLAAGVTGVNSAREFPLPWLERTDARWGDAAEWNHWEESLRAGFDPMQVGGGVSVDVADPAGSGELPTSLADPVFWGRLRARLLPHGPRWNRLGQSHFNIADEFHLPSQFDFHPITLLAFRPYLMTEYGSLAALNAAWQRDYANWDEVRPESLAAALARGNLGAWAAHRAFMESLVVRWRDESERLLREAIPDARVDMSNSLEGPDTGVDMAAHLEAAGWNTQYSGQDTIRKRDLRRTDTDLGIWLPFNLGRKLEPDEALEARFVPHEYLLEGYRDYLTWWGFEDFGWPFLRPDFGLCPQFSAMSGEFRTIRRGLDRLVLGAVRENRQVAGVFSQACWRTVYALDTGAGGKLPLWHDWELAAELLAPLPIRGHIVRPDGLATLDPAVTPLLALAGAIALPPSAAADLRRYVEAGGHLVADVLPGTFDERSVRRDPAAMAALFGVRWDGLEVGAGPPREVSADGPWAAVAGQPAVPLAMGLTLDGGQARGRAGEAPVLIEHAAGKGKTLLLNLVPRQWLGIGGIPGNRLARPSSAAELSARTALARALAEWAGMVPEVTVESADAMFPAPGAVSVFRDGEALLLGVMNGSYDPAATDRRVTIRTRTPMVVYTVGGEMQPAATTHEVTVPHHTAGYFVLIREPLPALAATAASVDGELAVTVKGGSQRRIVVVEVSEPDGTRRPELDGEAEVRGEATVRLATAMDDPGGAWRILVRDVVTGQRLELEVSR